MPALRGARVALLEAPLGTELADLVRALGGIPYAVPAEQMGVDIGPLTDLIDELVNGRVDAIAFTSQIQCRQLFDVARELGRSSQLVEALNSYTVVAVVGPVCAAALKARGIMPDVLPAQPRARPMLTALADYFELSEDPTE